MSEIGNRLSGDTPGGMEMTTKFWAAAMGAMCAMAIAPFASAQYDATPDWLVETELGIGTTNPTPPGSAGIDVVGTGNPGFRFFESGSTGFTAFFDDGQNGIFFRRAFSGPSQIWLAPRSDDTVSPVAVRIFSGTNTTGTRTVDIYRGNNTSAIDTRLSAGAANSWINAGGGNVGVGTTAPTQRLDVAGNIRSSGTMSSAIVEIRGSGNDLAEGFKIHGPEGAVQPGMVVSISPDHPGELMLSQSAFETTVAGIISGAGDKRVGIQLGNSEEVAAGELTPVALTGQVWCWVDASYGAVRPGDTLTTSATMGHAMKVTNFNQAAGAIIGKAMSSLDEGRGLVLVLVNLH